MLYGDHSSYLAYFFIGTLRSDEVEEREDQAANITKPLGANFHGGPEASVEGSQHPRGAEVGSVVHVRHWFWAGESDEGAEIASGIHGQERHDEDLP